MVIPVDDTVVCKASHTMLRNLHSGIENDPNNWAVEHNDRWYIVELVARIVRVSVETMRIVDGLPALGV